MDVQGNYRLSLQFFFRAFQTYDRARATTLQKAFHPSMLSYEIDIDKGGYGRA